MNVSDELDSNLSRLFVLRNITIAVQVTTVLILSFMDVQLPLKELFAVFFVMSVLNIFTWRYLHKKKRAQQNELFMQLLFDVLAFSVVLYLTGGATNPFAWFYLIPLVISATLLSRKLTWLIAFITISIYSFLMFFVFVKS